MNQIKSGGEFELLTHGRLRDSKIIRDLSLTHASGEHGSERECTAQSRNVFTALRVAVLVEEAHKTILSTGVRHGNRLNRAAARVTVNRARAR